MKKRLLLLFSLLICVYLHSMAQITSQRHEGPFKTGNRIHLCLKDIYTDKAIVDVKDRASVQILLDGKAISLDTIGKFGFQYHGVIPDSTCLIVHHPDYQSSNLTYLKKYHYKPHDAWIFVYMTRKKDDVNKIVVLGDQVEVNLNGKKKYYSVQALGRSSNTLSGNAQLLKKIPHFSISNNEIRVKGQLIHAIFLDGYLEYHRNQPTNTILLNELIK